MTMTNMKDTKLNLLCVERPRPPKLPAGVHWSRGIIIAMEDPLQVYEEDELTVTLYDGFPKARYHFLVVPKENINSIAELLPGHLPLLKRMHENAEKLVQKIQSIEPGVIFRQGYHAVPSMKRLHLHVVSQDFDSFRMKKKHHWNTFNTEYFVDSDVVMTTLEQAGKVEVVDNMYESLLELRMRCNFCNSLFDDIHSLKKHIRSHDSEQDKKLLCLAQTRHD